MSAVMKMPIHTHLWVALGILTSKVGQIDLVLLVCDQDSLVGPCMHEYNCLYVAVTICDTQVNIQTETHTDTVTHTHSTLTS